MSLLHRVVPLLLAVAAVHAQVDIPFKARPGGHEGNRAQVELFTYDSDMEFDIGVPWYRPTRINHVTSGAEFGWRSGSGVWLDHENGKRMFSAGMCIACHRFRGEGGISGPDLGSVGARFSIRDILVAICDPSASISEQYMASSVKLKDGRTLHGRLIVKNDKEVAMAPNPYDLNKLTRVAADDVASIEFSRQSPMPPGTISGMNRDELMDLMAYLLSGGDPQHKAFSRD